MPNGARETGREHSEHRELTIRGGSREDSGSFSGRVWFSHPSRQIQDSRVVYILIKCLLVPEKNISHI